ncbi:MAG: NAD(P)H-dependent oxidoreductase [Clostridia bacterium]|nr:NAD(P)H-dependent oxidoreductase [Clostridia bacterium]
MSKLFIYYSLSGNGDAVAENLKEKGFDVRKVGSAKQPPKRFFFQILQCGFNAGRKYCEPLKDYDADVSAYDTVVIGSPVWNGRLSCPINTVLKETNLSGKKVAFILYSGSGEAQKAEQQIRAVVPDAEIIHIKEPKKNPETFGRLSDL